MFATRARKGLESRYRACEILDVRRLIDFEVIDQRSRITLNGEVSVTLRATREHRGHELASVRIFAPSIQAISFYIVRAPGTRKTPRDHWSVLRALRWLTALDDEVLTQRMTRVTTFGYPCAIPFAILIGFVMSEVPGIGRE